MWRREGNNIMNGEAHKIIYEVLLAQVILDVLEKALDILLFFLSGFSIFHGVAFVLVRDSM